MNSNMKKLAALAYPLLLASMGSNIDSLSELGSTRVVKPDWERKKCKSCKQWRKYDRSQGCSIKPYISPNQQACEKYEKRKK